MELLCIRTHNPPKLKYALASINSTPGEKPCSDNMPPVSSKTPMYILCSSLEKQNRNQRVLKYRIIRKRMIQAQIRAIERMELSIHF